MVEEPSAILLPTNPLTSNAELDSSYMQTREHSHSASSAIDIMVAAVEQCRPNGNGNLLQYQTDCRCCMNQCSNANNLPKNISTLTISSTCKCQGECVFCVYVFHYRCVVV